LKTLTLIEEPLPPLDNPEDGEEEAPTKKATKPKAANSSSKAKAAKGASLAAPTEAKSTKAEEEAELDNAEEEFERILRESGTQWEVAI